MSGLKIQSIPFHSQWFNAFSRSVGRPLNDNVINRTRTHTHSHTIVNRLLVSEQKEEEEEEDEGGGGGKFTFA